MMTATMAMGATTPTMDRPLQFQAIAQTRTGQIPAEVLGHKKKARGQTAAERTCTDQELLAVPEMHILQGVRVEVIKCNKDEAIDQ